MAQPTLKPRDDAYNQKMNEYHAKRAAILNDKKNPDGYLGPEWNALSDEIKKFRSGYEPAKIYSPREYLLDNDIDEFQIDQVRDDISLEDVYKAMQNGEDFYEVASEGGHGFDSAVREKIFDGISNKLGVKYDDLYDLWLGKGKPVKKPANPAYSVNEKPSAPLLGSKSRFAQKYPDRFAELKKLYGKDPFFLSGNNDIEKADLDAIAELMGLELD